MTAHAVTDRPYSREEVVEIIKSVMANVGSDTDLTRKLQSELAALSSYIGNIRSELAQMRSIEISHTHIPSATDELDAVVVETAHATGVIMDQCDKMQHLGGKLSPEAQAEMEAIVTCIYEACGFQDITGQRITKVVKALKNIEAKVGDILTAFGHALPGAKATAPALQEKTSLLNGPQLKGPSISQDDIDKLLAGFDN